MAGITIIDNRISLDDLYDEWPHKHFYMKEILTSRDPAPLLFSALFSAPELENLVPIRESFEELQSLSTSTAKQLQFVTGIMINKWSQNGRRPPFASVDLRELFVDLGNMMDALPFAIFGNCRTLADYFTWQIRLLWNNEWPIEILTSPPQQWSIDWHQLSEPDALHRLRMASYQFNHPDQVDAAIDQTMYRVIAFACDLLLCCLMESFTFQRPYYHLPPQPPVNYTTPYPVPVAHSPIITANNSWMNTVNNEAWRSNPAWSSAVALPQNSPSAFPSNSYSTEHSYSSNSSERQPAARKYHNSVKRDSMTSFSAPSPSSYRDRDVSFTEEERKEEKPRKVARRPAKRLAGVNKSAAMLAAKRNVGNDTPTEDDEMVGADEEEESTWGEAEKAVDVRQQLIESIVGHPVTLSGQKRKGSDVASTVECPPPDVKKTVIAKNLAIAARIKAKGVKQEELDEYESEVAAGGSAMPMNDVQLLVASMESDEIVFVSQKKSELETPFSEDPWAKAVYCMSQDMELTYYYKLWFKHLIVLNLETRAEAGLPATEYYHVEDCYLATEPPTPDEWTVSVRKMMADQDLAIWYKLWFKQLIGEIRQLRVEMASP